MDKAVFAGQRSSPPALPIRRKQSLPLAVLRPPAHPFVG